MKSLFHLTTQLIQSFDVPDLELPVAGVNIYKQGVELPPVVTDSITPYLTLTSCQAVRQAALGDSVTLTIDNIGCVAAAISFGLVDAMAPEPLGGSRVYTDLMTGRNVQGDAFQAPSPRDFTEGRVYACQDGGHNGFCLFGEDDAGRFASNEVARKAIADMLALQPADTQAVFFAPPDKDIDIIPDVVVISARPVELTRLIQGYQYMTGERVTANIGPLRAVNSDLIVRPYLEQRINITPYCLGARLIGQFEADRMGIGMPWKHFVTLVEGMEKSRKGYPFPQYPGARESGI